MTAHTHKQMAEVLLAVAEDSAASLQCATSLWDVNKVVIDLVEEFAFALGPLAYEATTPADLERLTALADLADTVLDIAALLARVDDASAARMVSEGAVGVLGTLVLLVRQRGVGEVTPLLVADVASWLYGAQGWVGADSAARGAGDQLVLSGTCSDPPVVWMEYDRTALVEGWVKKQKPREEQRRRNRRLRRLGREGGASTDSARLADLLASGVRRARGQNRRPSQAKATKEPRAPRRLNRLRHGRWWCIYCGHPIQGPNQSEVIHCPSCNVRRPAWSRGAWPEWAGSIIGIASGLVGADVLGEVFRGWWLAWALVTLPLGWFAGGVVGSTLDRILSALARRRRPSPRHRQDGSWWCIYCGSPSTSDASVCSDCGLHRPAWSWESWPAWTPFVIGIAAAPVGADVIGDAIGGPKPVWGLLAFPIGVFTGSVLVDLVNRMLSPLRRG